MHVNWATNVPPMHAFVYHITQYAVKAIPKNNRNPEQQRAKVLKEVGVLKEVEVGVTGGGACRGHHLAMRAPSAQAKPMGSGFNA